MCHITPVGRTSVEAVGIMLHILRDNSSHRIVMPRKIGLITVGAHFIGMNGEDVHETGL
jgi:hypothetical protein